MKIIMRISAITIILLSISFSVFAQNCKVYGIIKSNNPITNVNIYIPELNVSTISDKNGKYEITNLPNNTLTLLFSHVGYSQIEKEIKLKSNENYELNIFMKEIIIELNEAEVISSKNEQNIRDISFPIELVSKSKLNYSNQATISDILKNESGVSLVKDSPWGTAINIRGLSKQNIVYLIDGNRIETSTNIAAGLSLINLNDIQSIEVVKGGLSSLYGTGATGGVVNIISKEIDFNNRNRVYSQINSTYNSVNNSSINSVNVNYASHNLTAKINGTIRRADNTDTPNGELSNSSYNDESFNLSMKYSPFTNVITKVEYQKFSAFDVGIPGGSPFPSTASAKYKYAKREMISGAILFSDISKYLIKSNIKYYHHKIDRSVEIKPNAIVTSAPQAIHITNGLTLQTDWDLWNDNYLVVGIDYWQREYDGIRTITNSAQKVERFDKPIPDSKFQSIGIFAQDEFTLMKDKLKLFLSGRYDIINISNAETNNPLYTLKDGIEIPTAKIENASFVEQKEKNKSISGGFGAIYKLTKDYDLTFNTGYNFRSPSLEERYQFIDLGGIVYFGNPNLKPEEGVFFDAGFRIWKDKLNFRFNTFINSFSNLVQDVSVIPDSIYEKQNIGEARLYGFDLSFDYNFYKNYLTYLKLAYVRGEDILENSNLPEIPPFNGVLGLKIPIDNVMNIDLSSTFAFDQNNIANGESTTKGYIYFDVSLLSNDYVVNFMNLKVIAGVQNIFNKEYREHLSTYRGIKMYEPGRNLFVKLIVGFE